MATPIKGVYGYFRGDFLKGEGKKFSKTFGCGLMEMIFQELFNHEKLKRDQQKSYPSSVF
jgi:hypothetical protein